MYRTLGNLQDISVQKCSCSSSCNHCTSSCQPHVEHSCARLGAALGGRQVHVFDETLITYAVRSPVATKTALAAPRERERSRWHLEGGNSTLHSQQSVAKCQQGT